MANFEHYATFDESIAMLRDIVAAGFRVTWDPGVFTDPNPPMYSEVTDELIQKLRAEPHYFLALPTARLPPPVDLFEEGVNQGKYSFDVFSAEDHLAVTWRASGKSTVSRH